MSKRARKGPLVGGFPTLKGDNSELKAALDEGAQMLQDFGEAYIDSQHRLAERCLELDKAEQRKAEDQRKSAVHLEQIAVAVAKLRTSDSLGKPKRSKKGKPGRKATHDDTVWMPRYEEWKAEKSRSGLKVAQWAALNNLESLEVEAAFKAMRDRRRRRT